MRVHLLRKETATRGVAGSVLHILRQLRSLSILEKQGWYDGMMKNDPHVALRRSARALILNGQNQLLVFERTRQNTIFSKLHHYYSIPGGGMDAGETPEQAVVRELKEEMLIDIVPERFVIRQFDHEHGRENNYFLVRIVSGTPTFNPESEEALSKRYFRHNSFEIAWVDLDSPLLDHHKAYRQVADQIREWIERDTFPALPVDMTV